MTISALQASLFGIGGSNAYFPAVWFVEDETTVPPYLLRPGPGSFYSVSRPQHGKRRRLYDLNVERDRARRKHEDEFLLLSS